MVDEQPRCMHDVPREDGCFKCGKMLRAREGAAPNIVSDTIGVDATRGVQHVHDHPDHPPVIPGGYRGQGATAEVTLPGPETPLANSIIGEAMLADSVRTYVLPTDSAERKRIPLCAGAIDYFPAALARVFDAVRDGDDMWSSDDASILVYLADRDCVALLGACLDALQDELNPIHGTAYADGLARPSNPAVRWSAALVEVARVSVYGNEKHNPGEPLHHARGKSMDHADCIARHTFDAAAGVLFDGPMRHRACRAWRAGALGQEAAEAEGAPLARGARLP